MGTRVAVMAGGTGGHVFPALAVAEALRQQGVEVFWVGTRAGMEATLVPERGYEVEWIRIEGLRGKGLAQLLRAPFRLAGAISQARRVFRRRRPDLVLGMGGFVSGPGGIAAKLLGIPLVVQEQNFVPGMTNQWLARIASAVFEAFPGSFQAARRAVCSGNPVRRDILALPPPVERLAGRDGPAHLLVLGGSLGARALNEVLPSALAALPAELRPEVRHQAGERTLSVAQGAYREAGVDAEVTPFIGDMAEAYSWADLVVCRAGALTVSELAAAGAAAVLVPYPFAVDDHQVGNARYLVDAGAARMILQKELTSEGLSRLLTELLGDRALLRSMSDAARSRARPDAAERIAAACLALIRNRRRPAGAMRDVQAQGGRRP